MKTKITVLTIIMSVLLITVIFYLLGKNEFPNKEIYEIIWKVDMPSDYKVIYHMQDDRGFQGDGNRYTILQLTGDNSFPLKYEEAENMQEIEGDSTNGNDSEIKSFVNEIITKLNVPKEYQPVYLGRYSWQKLVKHESDILVILYFPDVKWIYFIERLI